MRFIKRKILHYEETFCFLVSEGSCELEYCEETGGTCLSNKKSEIECKCPEGTDYVKDYGCKGKGN